MRPENLGRPEDMPADRPTPDTRSAGSAMGRYSPARSRTSVMRHGTRVGRCWRADWRHLVLACPALAGGANVNRVVATASTPGAALAHPQVLAGRPADTRAWFVALLSLLLAGNLVTSRYLFWDVFYDLYAGRYILRHGLPHQNLITVASYHATWQDQQWLAHVLYYAIWAAGGYRLLAAASATLVTAGFGLLGLLMLRRGVPPTRAFAWTAAAFLVALGSVGIRAQSLAYPCFALILWLLVADDRGPRLRPWTWLAIPVLVFWANTHGSVLLGAGLAGLYAGYRAVKASARRDYGAVPAFLAFGAAAGAAVICTPYGTGVIQDYDRFIGNPELTRNIVEWATPSPLDPFSWAFFMLISAVAFAVALAWRRGVRPDPLLCGVALLLLAVAFTAVRNQQWFAFAGSLLAADTLARGNGGKVPELGGAFRKVTTGVLVLLAVVSASVLALTSSQQFQSEIPRRAIDVAATLAAKNPAIRILGDPWSGTSMLWLHPATISRVGFDARMELYSGRELSAYFDFLFVRGHRWQRVTRGYGIIVASRVHDPGFADALARLPGWRVAYKDRNGLVLTRQATSEDPRS